MSFLTIFSGFFCELAQEGANWRECDPEKSWFRTTPGRGGTRCELEPVSIPFLSQSVRLAALRSILSDMMAVSDFAGLEERIAKLEEQDRVRPQEGAFDVGSDLGSLVA
jgi:hypothetical protein